MNQLHYFTNLIAQTRNLYKTDFTPQQQTQQSKKTSLKIKLNNEFEYAINKYQKMKQQKTNKQQSNKYQQNPQSRTILQPPKSDIIQKVIKQLLTNSPKQKSIIKTFESYKNNTNKIYSQQSKINTLIPTNKLQINLQQATKLGTIKSNSIRKLIKPNWHAPFKLYRVIVGHHGWVRAIAISPCNSFFASGSADRTIKFWDLVSGELKISLTGHINTIRGLQFSNKHPYLFSCGEDKSIKCWDLQMNKVIRSYHGHLSGVYCLKVHNDLSVIVTGGRDSTARVWDIRVRRQVHALVGHTHTVGSVLCQQNQPHVITGSYDSFVKLWDIGTGKCIKTLTNHKKSIRTMVQHPRQYTFATAASDNIKIWRCPNGQFLRNISGHNSIIDSMAINQQGVLVTGGDDGTMKFWDWNSGYNFQNVNAVPQPGSIAAENAVFALAYDRSGTRLLTGECDKSIKMYKSDDKATQQSFPIKSFKMEFY